MVCDLGFRSLPCSSSEQKQESLDSLSQGTGLGLSLCKILIGLLGGDVWLDETFDSGIKGRPGARFIIDLQSPPLQLDDESDQCVARESALGGDVEAQSANGTSNGMTPGMSITPTPKFSAKPSEELRLPEELTVLFVDDDTVLRKLFVRAVRRIAPKWKTQEAASGEAALRLIDELGDTGESHFDIIFMDQYMASTEKQLLGTEATTALRSKGVKSKICGLSANEIANDFFAAGSNAFICKPLPAQQDILRTVLYELLCEDSAPEQARSRSSLVHKPASLGHA